MKRTYKIAAAVAVTLGLAAAAYAYPGDGFGPGSGPCAGDGPRGGMMGPHGRAGNAGHFDPAAMIEGRLAYLKAELKITKAQETAWQAYSVKAREQAASMLAMRGAMQNEKNATVSAPERLAEHTAMMKQRLGQMETMSVAVKDLYAALTPEQKTIADQEFGNMGGFMGGHRGGHMGGFMGGDGMGYGRR